MPAPPHVGHAWCGLEPAGLFVAGSLNPCYFNTVASLAIALNTATVVISQVGRVRALRSLGRSRSYLWPAPGCAAYSVQIAAAVAVALAHAVVLAWSLEQVGQRTCAAGARRLKRHLRARRLAGQLAPATAGRGRARHPCSPPAPRVGAPAALPARQRRPAAGGVAVPAGESSRLRPPSAALPALQPGPHHL